MKKQRGPEAVSRETNSKETFSFSIPLSIEAKQWTKREGEKEEIEELVSSSPILLEGIEIHLRKEKFTSYRSLIVETHFLQYISKKDTRN